MKQLGFKALPLSLRLGDMPLPGRRLAEPEDIVFKEQTHSEIDKKWRLRVLLSFIAVKIVIATVAGLLLHLEVEKRVAKRLEQLKVNNHGITKF